MEVWIIWYVRFGGKKEKETQKKKKNHICCRSDSQYGFWRCQNRWPIWRNRGPILVVFLAFSFGKNRCPIRQKSLCKVNHHYSGTEGCSLPRLGQFWIELGKQISCVLSLSFSRCFSTFACVYNCHPLCFDCLINLLHT